MFLGYTPWVVPTNTNMFFFWDAARGGYRLMEGAILIRHLGKYQYIRLPTPGRLPLLLLLPE